MKKIVVTTDGSNESEAAFPFADELRRDMNAEVVLTLVGPVAETKVQAQEERHDLEEKLDAAADRFPAAVRRRLEPAGDPVDGILHVAREEHADLIVMATHGRSGLSALSHGSVADGVLRRAGVPVVLVPCGSRRGG